MDSDCSRFGAWLFLHGFLPFLGALLGVAAWDSACLVGRRLGFPHLWSSGATLVLLFGLAAVTFALVFVGAAPAVVVGCH